MALWGLILEQNIGAGRGNRMWSVGVMGHVDGTREEALAALRERAESFEPVHPYTVRRRRLYEEEGGFLVVLEGSWQEFHIRFTVARQLADSNPPPAPPQRPAEPAGPVPPRSPKAPGPPVPPPPPRDWDAEVPERPAWLGRDDLG
ncbi:hypothetical protein ACIRP0_34705 [Streptomyces sp. NPDC101733]|uniref:hypothetical protein n=1 Tax=unclassified Streptomyces TaxID=2593676 RepID=UPI0038188E69